MPAQTAQANQVMVKSPNLASGVVRNGKGYIIDGEEVKGIMLRWKRYRMRIEAMEREAGFMINKKGHRVALRQLEHLKRNAEQAELPEEAAEASSSAASETDAEEETEEAEDAKKKSPPKPKKKPAKRLKTKH